jgi:hypothetical protein
VGFGGVGGEGGPRSTLLSCLSLEDDDRKKGEVVAEGVRTKRWVGPILVLGCSVEEERERGPG